MLAVFTLLYKIMSVLYLINTPKRMCIVLVTSTEIDMLSHLDTLSVIDHDLKELDEWSKKWLMTFNSEKTEIMLFSNTDIPEFNFTFNRRTILITNSHKHLGVSFSSDAKWNIHVENILLCIYKHLNVLRMLKYKLSRENLEKLYLVYIRPIFEYACEVWYNCGVGNSNKLHHLHLEAARIVTGLPIFASSILIYKELGWESLAERRKRRKLQMFYNIQNNNAPMYLCDLIPPSTQSTTVYSLRNGSDIIMPFCRLSNIYDSFIPSTIRQWNSLDPSLRNVDSIAKFKAELRKRKDSSQVPKHYEIGPRKLNNILTQLRCFASFLNYDLFKVNIVSDPSCRCGANREDSYHFFFDCSHYSNIRHTLFQNLNWLPNYCALDLTLSTCGNPTLSYEQNEIIFKHVFEYIKRSDRFLVVHQNNNHTHHHHQPSLSFLSSFSVFVQSTHINVRNIYIHACSIK